jgi:hypothetical protein
MWGSGASKKENKTLAASALAECTLFFPLFGQKCCCCCRQRTLHLHIHLVRRQPRRTHGLGGPRLHLKWTAAAAGFQCLASRDAYWIMAEETNDLYKTGRRGGCTYGHVQSCKGY